VTTRAQYDNHSTPPALFLKNRWGSGSGDGIRNRVYRGRPTSRPILSLCTPKNVPTSTHTTQTQGGGRKEKPMFTVLSLPIANWMITSKRATPDSVMAVTVLGMILDLAGVCYLIVAL
jgi:hypothetical protein